MKKICQLFFMAVTAVLFAGCATTSSEPCKPLVDTAWAVVQLENQGDLKLAEGSSAWFRINADNQVTGVGGVNRFNSRATIDADAGKLTFAPGAATLMAGPNLAFESKFMVMLGAVRSYSIQGDTLTLCGEDGKPLATFKAEPGK